MNSSSEDPNVVRRSETSADAALYLPEGLRFKVGDRVFVRTNWPRPDSFFGTVALICNHLHSSDGALYHVWRDNVVFPRRVFVECLFKTVTQEIADEFRAG